MPKINNTINRIDEEKIPKGKKKCSECKRVISLNNFYNTKNILSGDGKAGICKDCIKKKIDYDNIQSIYDILQALDLPFFYDSWARSIEKNPDNPFGVYIRMANSGINEFEGRNWSDSCFLPNVNNITKHQTDNTITTSISNTSTDIFRNFTVTDEIIDKWGFGYSDEEYYYFEKKWAKLIDNYGEKTSLHVEGLTTYIRFRVKEELATADGNTKESRDWADLAEKASKSAKLTVSQLSKSDISGGVDLVPQLFEAVESEDGIIPILPHLKEQPYDDADMIIWCIINYIRRLEDKPRVEYKDIWSFYDEMLNDYYISQGYSPEMIDKEKNKRNAVFRDLGQFYKEPVYEEGE